MLALSWLLPAAFVTHSPQLVPPHASHRCSSASLALPSFDSLFQRKEKQKRPLSEAVALRDALVGPGNIDPTELDPLIEACTMARVPFSASGLGGGLWRASYTRGETPRWERFAKLLPFSRNKAGQAYDPDALRVVNYGEVVGPNIFFTAEGTFAPVDEGGSRCPQDFTVAIEQGGLVLFGQRLVSSAISGPGYLCAPRFRPMTPKPPPPATCCFGSWAGVSSPTVETHDGCCVRPDRGAPT